MKINTILPGISVILMAIGWLTTGCNSAQQVKKKPNLLFIITDEQRTNTMAAYGNTKIKTPNLNRLADQSFVFRNAYVTQPVCTPSRAAIMTGLYPHTSGCVSNNIPLNDSIPAFPGLLNDADYQTAYMGKWHLGDEIYPQQGFNTWVSIEDLYSSHFRPNRDQNDRSSYHHWLIKNGFKPDRNGNKFSREFAAKLPLEYSKPHFLAEHACQYLEQNKDKPFILYLSFLEPHMPFTGPLDSLYDPSYVDLPENFSDTFGPNDPLRYRLKRENAIKHYGSKESDIRALIARYWGLVTEVDQSVGTVLDKLRQLGLDDHTIVVYTTDHGDMMGAHAMVEKQVMLQEAVHVPFLLKDPLINRQQQFIDQPVSQIDIVPTLLDLMGKHVPERLQGKSLVPVLKGKKDQKSYVYIEWNPDDNYRNGVNKHTKIASEEEIKQVGTSSTIGVIAPDGWKLCLSEKDKNQLYNLNEDPLETTNLYDDPKYQSRIRMLTEKIWEWQIKTGDHKNVIPQDLM